MLVLTRRVGEAIQIGDNIVVYVTRTSGNRVTIGIEAPRSVGILRGELTNLNPFESAQVTPPAGWTSGDSPTVSS